MIGVTALDFPYPSGVKKLMWPAIRCQLRMPFRQHGNVFLLRKAMSNDEGPQISAASLYSYLGMLLSAETKELRD